ncbi:hypothetical protein PHYPSEUDO_006826 [Phytophthora pseudosyringae]|uniref:Uncharacterized protein n=1 Tax=Phytophthora pseudosyringae TaxID=221518 RepID=A0A8T1VIE0_9STRA|nr:hypothetical protein PHYPSEUDO_006826 [Phytophthora pseudosyringae]
MADAEMKDTPALSFIERLLTIVFEVLEARRELDLRKTPLPPFILTQTMDAMLGTFGVLTSLLTSQSRVFNTERGKALLSMSGVVWSKATPWRTNGDLTSNLLIRIKPNDAGSYTLNGVSSLFCRVGRRATHQTGS